MAMARTKTKEDNGNGANLTDDELAFYDCRESNDRAV
jgi:hypothetical protein